MFNLCIAELNEIIEGCVSLGAMPPLAGLFEPVGRMVVDVREVRNRDVLWMFDSQTQPACWHADDAFSRGALGIVAAGHRMEPWAGKFCASVADPIAALHRLMRCVRTQDGRWPETVFGQDETTQAMMRAVWNRDGEAIQAIVAQLGQRATSAA